MIQPRRTFLQTIALAPIGLSVCDAVAQTKDTALLALGFRLNEAAANLEAVIAATTDDDSPEANQAFEDAYDCRSDVIACIEEIPATSLDGIKVKLRALDSIYREQQGGPRVEDLANDPTTDMRLVVQILDSLRAL